jgi:glycine/D-amino acid oxidase-like deaminating enzyme
MKIINDDNCGWLKTLPDRLKYQDIANDLNCEWIIIGAGYTGLSAARTLGNLYPNKKIILVDAQFAAEGASSRNSGYLVDTILNDGFTSNKEVRNYKKKNRNI